MTGAKEQEGSESSGARGVAADQVSGSDFGSGPKPQGSAPDTLLGNSFWGSVIPAGYLIAGRYRIEHFIARGGMGEVYAAHDCVLADRVALKTVTATASNDADALAALRAEVTLSRKISHPNVCRMHDIGVHVSQDATQLTFLTMEYIEGESLGARVLREGPIPEAEASRLLAGILAGLQAAHEAGVLHRDLKSDNVMLRSRLNAEPAPVIMDFGLASVLSPNSSRVSSEQAMVGSLAYMAPEQVQGDALRVVTDIYSVGVIFFEMLTGQLPFKASSPALAALKRLHEPAPRVRSIDPRVSPELDRILAKALRHRPQDRYPSARAMLQDLLAHMGNGERELSDLSLRDAVSSKPATEPSDFSHDETTLVSGRPKPARRVSVVGDSPPASEDHSLPVLAATTPPAGASPVRRFRGKVIGGAVALTSVLTVFAWRLPQSAPDSASNVTMSIGAGNDQPISVPPGATGVFPSEPSTELVRPEVARQTTPGDTPTKHIAAAPATGTRNMAVTESPPHALSSHALAPEGGGGFGKNPPRGPGSASLARPPSSAAPSSGPASATAAPTTNAGLVYPPGLKRPTILRPSDASGLQ